MDVHRTRVQDQTPTAHTLDRRSRRHNHIAIGIMDKHHDTSNGSRPNKASTDTSK